MITKEDIIMLQDEYNSEFKKGNITPPCEKAYKNLLAGITSHYSRTHWEHYVNLTERMPEEIEEAYTGLRKILEPILE